MPEEIDRLIVDAIADVLWTRSVDADENPIAEGGAPQRIDYIGTIMIDSFEMLRKRVEFGVARTEKGLEPGRYAVVSLHSPTNVDFAETLAPIEAPINASHPLTIAFLAHPRTIVGLVSMVLTVQLKRNFCWPKSAASGRIV